MPVLALVASHDQKSHGLPHFSFLDLTTNTFIPMTMPLATPETIQLPVVSHDNESHFFLHFDHLDLMIVMVTLILLSV